MVGNTEERLPNAALTLFPTPENAMRHIPYAMLIALCGCGDQTRVTQPGAPLASLAEAQYTITKLLSLGGSQSRGMAINQQGMISGWSNKPDGTRRAVLWQDHQSITDLGKLGGLSSAVPWLGLNDGGTVVGISHTDEVDPLDEEWACEAVGFLPHTTNLICRGFVSENGRMRELPTLGGNHSFGTGVNNHGLVVGWAETPVHDPTCNPLTAQKLQFRAVMWDPKDGSNGKIKTRELRPFADDSTSAATAINDSGQAVGISGDCDQGVGRYSARHAVLWNKNGKVIEIPNLGGTSWHTPMDINAAGDVVGFSNPDEPGDEIGDFIARAFLWTHGAATARDLGTLGDDAVSEAFAINSRGQVVGVSFGGSSGPRAFLYEGGTLKDLNDLVDSDDVLLSAQDINDAGQITGRLSDHATGKVLAFVATPTAPTP
jgi:probable HAF family extracellular repeat protein